MFDMWPGVVMVKHDVFLLVRTFGFDSGFQAMELSQIDVAVKIVLLFPISIRNRPFMLHIVVVPPVTETFLANLSDDFPVNNPRAIPPYTSHGLLAVKVFWNAFRRFSTVNAHLLSLGILEE